MLCRGAGGALLGGICFRIWFGLREDLAVAGYCDACTVCEFFTWLQNIHIYYILELLKLVDLVKQIKRLQVASVSGGCDYYYYFCLSWLLEGIVLPIAWSSLLEALLGFGGGTAVAIWGGGLLGIYCQSNYYFLKHLVFSTGPDIWNFLFHLLVFEVLRKQGIFIPTVW